MMNSKRREFLQQSGMSLAAVGVAGLVLRADALPTRAAPSEEGEAGRVLIQMEPPPKELTKASGELKKMTPVVYGPFYRPGAPFRGKLCPPGEPGTTFVLTGRVWAFDTKRPLPGVVLDIWHVDMQEQYSDGVKDLRNRGRLVSSETGAYEVESIRPIPYRPNPSGRLLALRALSPARRPPRLQASGDGNPFQRRPQKDRPDVSPRERHRRRTAHGERQDLRDGRLRHRAGARRGLEMNAA